MTAVGGTGISIHDLRVRRGGREVVRGVSLEIPRGQVTGLLGPSGCGKTTLMRAIVGVQAAVTGTVNVLGRAAGSRDLRSRVGYLTQAPSVYDDLTVLENLRYFARVYGLPPSRGSEVIEAVGLVGHAGQVVRRLSGGERARVSLATALLNHPEVLVLDEPTVGLDPVLRRDLWTMFGRLAAEGAALLVSSHVMDEAERCGQLILMREGVVLAAGQPAELLGRTGATDIEGAFLALVEQGVPA